MKLKTIRMAELELDGGAKIELCFLGKGMYHNCYVDREQEFVYSVPIQKNPAKGTVEDISKEIMAFAWGSNQTNQHIPAVDRIGWLNDEIPVYKMPFYPPLTAAWEEAWTQLKFLNSFEPADKSLLYENAELASKWPKLAEAMDTIIHTAWDYGQYADPWFLEFPKRNLRVDKDGNLVLLDVLFCPFK
jgi:hypothetical protein